MSKKFKISLSIIIILIIVSTWAFVVSKKMTKNVNNNVSEVQTVSDEDANVKELILTESKNGKKFWELCAASGNYDSTSGQVHLTNVQGNFYKNNKVVLSFDSPAAIYYDKDKDVKLSGGARAATANEILITANELYWKGKKDIITATGNVKIRRKSGLLVTGNKSIFSIKSSKIIMIGSVTTRLLKKDK